MNGPESQKRADPNQSGATAGRDRHLHQHSKDVKPVNPIAIELLAIIVELLQSQQREIAALRQEENEEVADDAALTPRLKDLLARLQMSAPPASPEMPADM